MRLAAVTALAAVAERATAAEDAAAAAAAAAGRLAIPALAAIRSEVNIELNFAPKLRGARSRLYRRRF